MRELLWGSQPARVHSGDECKMWIAFEIVWLLARHHNRVLFWLEYLISLKFREMMQFSEDAQCGSVDDCTAVLSEKQGLYASSVLSVRRQTSFCWGLWAACPLSLFFISVYIYAYIHIYACGCTFTEPLKPPYLLYLRTVANDGNKKKIPSLWWSRLVWQGILLR